MRRLQKEKDVLTETVRYYSAASALKSAFSPTAVTAEEPSYPLPGGDSGGAVGESSTVTDPTQTTGASSGNSDGKDN